MTDSLTPVLILIVVVLSAICLLAEWLRPGPINTQTHIPPRRRRRRLVIRTLKNKKGS